MLRVSRNLSLSFAYSSEVVTVRDLKLWIEFITKAKNSSILSEMVILSGRRHLGFSVLTKNIAINSFYVSHRYF